jgi:hypothetical protein
MEVRLGRAGLTTLHCKRVPNAKTALGQRTKSLPRYPLRGRGSRSVYAEIADI